ncbi:MAG TPA: hypothetical protein VFV87_04800 [Pirellulaceae bacterium]|nr:hypothetical protein [Pirellulaceae bacterium]
MSAVLLISVLAAVGQGPAVEEPASAKAVEVFRAEAAEYVVRLQSRQNEKLALEKEPVLRWSNPARTGEDGATFIWTLDGRPEMIGTVFTYLYNDKINRKHEYHSLATEPLAAEFRGKEVWSPKAAGVKFAPVAGAPLPAGSSRLRLTQIKALARDFSASMKDEEGESYQLRLLTQPLFRYEPEDKRVLDGALFAFSLGTDPEVLLMIEARPVASGNQWQFALARFHYVDLKGFYKDREVFHAEPLLNINNLNLGDSQYRDSVYATYHAQRNVPVEE